MRLNRKLVPVLITWDIDPDRWATADHRENALSMAIDLCEDLGISSTFFFTARFAHEYPAHIKRMRQEDHEVGCHGWMHTDEEDYDRLAHGLQQDYITKATQTLCEVTGLPVHSFRSPRVKTSPYTMELLTTLGYQVDSSVCSQRFDVLSSNLINFGWLVAPRRPYHPHVRNVYRRGSVSILEVPISAALAPFISGSLKVLGQQAMKRLAWLLYTESRATGKPIVYLAHPTEFIALQNRRTRISLSDFSPKRVRTHGFLVRNLLFRLVGQDLYNATRDLFSYIASLPGVVFMTCHEYASFETQMANSRHPETYPG